MDRNEAIEIVRMCCPKISNSECDFETAMRVLVPELADSEDEKIRRELISLFQDCINCKNHPYNASDSRRWIAWLEKQSEPQPYKGNADIMRKNLIKAFKSVGGNHWGGFDVRDIIHFLESKDAIELEKQGETNETINRDKFAQSVLKGAAINLIAWIDYNAAEGNMCLSNMECKDIEDALVSGNWDKIYAYIKKKLEKQGEQKIELKFKVGDWVTDGEYTWKVTNIRRLDYILQSQNGDTVDDTISYVDEHFYLWTIEDAKNGDVLVADDNEPFIFKGLLDTKHPNYPVAYCGLDSEDYFIVSRSNIWWTDEYVKPATKEQRDLLSQKMKETGYEWDADKKVLVMVGIDNDKEDKRYEELMEDGETNIEQNFTDSYCKEHCKGFQETGKCFADGECKAKREAEQKSAWSEEDENFFANINTIIDADRNFTEYAKRRCKDWLKSLKPQPHWKPTEEQLNFLIDLSDNPGLYLEERRLLEEIYNDLKKL